VAISNPKPTDARAYNNVHKDTVQWDAEAIRNHLVGSDGTSLALGEGLVNFSYDYGSVAYPDSVTEVYTFKVGGSGGTTSGVITLVYTDSSKDSLSSFARS